MTGKRKYFPVRAQVGCIWFIASIILFTSGCTPLRKKFTRKKKQDKEAQEKFIPVLEPIEYAKKEYPSEHYYKQHYSIWQVWTKDLLQTIERDESEKRQKYLLGQSIAQLEEMSEWLQSDKRAELSGLIERFKGVQGEYERPSSMRNMIAIKNRISRCAKAVRNDFSPSEDLPYK